MAAAAAADDIHYWSCTVVDVEKLLMSWENLKTVIVKQVHVAQSQKMGDYYYYSQYQLIQAENLV